MLARGVSQALHIPTNELVLVRQRVTRAQTHLSRAQRWTNVSGAFCVSEPEVVAHRRILLIDDVITTGATTVAASMALREAGASSVAVAALAVVRA